MSRADSPSQPTWDQGNLHIRWLGKEQTLTVPIPVGEATLLDLLPAARQLADAAAATAIADASERGLAVSCGPRCGACCRQLVAISVVEAVALADCVEAMPSERRETVRSRFAQAVQTLETNGFLDPKGKEGDRDLMARRLGGREDAIYDLGQRYFALGIACPLLEDESCSIHAERLLVCREHHVTTPAKRCAGLYQERVVRLEPAVRVGEAMARTADKVTGLGRWMIPLVLALEWSEHHASECRSVRDGLFLVRSFVAELDPAFREQNNSARASEPA